MIFFEKNKVLGVEPNRVLNNSIQEKALKMALSGHNLLITGYPEVA
jgi:hypothetical protein